MNLSESEDSKDSDDFGVELIDTSDSGNKSKSGLSGYMDLTRKFSLSASSDFSLSGSLMSSLVLLSSLEDLLPLVFVLSSTFLSQLLECSAKLSISFLLLAEAFGLGNCDFFACHYHKRIKIIFPNLLKIFN